MRQPPENDPYQAKYSRHPNHLAGPTPNGTLDSRGHCVYVHGERSLRHLTRKAGSHVTRANNNYGNPSWRELCLKCEREAIGSGL